VTEDETKYWDNRMAEISVKMDDILDKLKAVREDVDNSRGQVLFGLQENLTLSQRITKLEQTMRRPGAP
jgi:hypothetical protein